jgi:hypothetical protein
MIVAVSVEIECDRLRRERPEPVGSEIIDIFGGAFVILKVLDVFSALLAIEFAPRRRLTEPSMM